MHPIASWFHAVDLYDEIRVEHRPGHQRGASRRPARGLELLSNWAPDAPFPSEMDWQAEDDLAVRALRLIEGHIGEELPVLLHITKRIPVGSGLGGGSSDAAAVMVALNEIFALGITPADMLRLSCSIGSDLAFFLDDRQPPPPALVTLNGTLVEHTTPVDARVLLVFPPFGCSTPDVYRAYDRLGPAQLRAPEVRALTGEPLKPAMLFNDLAGAAEQLHPELAAIRARLAQLTTEPIHMSGSGSTLFIITSNPESLAQRVSEAMPDLRCLPTRLL
jgi:4-diphosphocytidyl-2-C-methyl-D-erythritol kinase